MKRFKWKGHKDNVYVLSQCAVEPDIQTCHLATGMCIAIEPMINLGGKEIYTANDGWTILTADGKASAHFEHTIAIMDDGPKILSKVSKNG